MPNYFPEHLNLYVTALREEREVEGTSGVDISNIVPVHLGGKINFCFYTQGVLHCKHALVLPARRLGADTLQDLVICRMLYRNSYRQSQPRR